MDKPPQPGFVPPPPYSPQPASDSFYVPPPQTAPTPVVIMSTCQQFGPEPIRMTCPSCHQNIVTTVETEATSKTHLFAILLCILCCWPCVVVPYCVDSCMAKKHYCPKCRSYLGSYDN